MSDSPFSSGPFDDDFSFDDDDDLFGAASSSSAARPPLPSLTPKPAAPRQDLDDLFGGDPFDDDDDFGFDDEFADFGVDEKPAPPLPFYQRKAAPTPAPSRPGSPFDDDYDPFDDDDDFGVIDDETISDETIETAPRRAWKLPDALFEYQIEALADLGQVRDALAQVMMLKPKDRQAVLGALVEKWLASRHYKAAMSAAMIADLSGDEQQWEVIATTAAERDEIALLEQAIADHRALEIGAGMYFVLVVQLLVRKDARVNTVWPQFVAYAEKIRNLKAQVWCLGTALQITTLVPMPDKAFSALNSLLELPESDAGSFLLILQSAGKLLTVENVTLLYRAIERLIERYQHIERLPRHDTRLFAHWANATGENEMFLLLYTAPPHIIYDGYRLLIRIFADADSQPEGAASAYFYLLMIEFMAGRGDADVTTLMTLSLILKDDFYSIFEDDLTHTAAELIARFASMTFDGVAAFSDHILSLIDRMKYDLDRGQWAYRFAAIFALMGAHPQAQQCLDRLLTLESQADILFNRLHYATVQALMGADADEVNRFIDGTISMWDAASEKRLDLMGRIPEWRKVDARFMANMAYSARSLRANQSQMERLLNLNPDADPEPDPGVKDVPIQELAMLATALGLADRPELLRSFLQRLSPRVVWRVFYTLAASARIADPDEAPPSADWLPMHHQHVAVLNNRSYQHLVEAMLSAAQPPQEAQYDLLLTLKFLNEDGFTAQAEQLAAWLEDEMLKERWETEKHLPTRAARVVEVDDEAPSISHHGLSELEPLLKESDALLTGGRYQQALQVIRSFPAMLDRAPYLRRAANAMARAGDRQAREVFEEAVRAARAKQSRSIEKPGYDELKELTRIAATAHPDQVLGMLGGLDAGRVDRYQDTVLCGVVEALAGLRRFEDAERLAALMHVDPWRTQAQAALVTAYAAVGQADRAQAIMAQAEGKVNRFCVLCAFVAGAPTPGEAAPFLDVARAMIADFPRSYHRAWAARLLAETLLKRQHPQADAALDSALSAIHAQTDMLSRFYALVDLLGVLLTHNHPRAASVLATAQAVIHEAENTAPVPARSATDAGHRISMKIIAGVDVLEGKWNLYNQVALLGQEWEITAYLLLANLLAKHNRQSEADAMLSAARTLNTSRFGWNLSDEFAKVASLDELKLSFERLGSRPLIEVFEILLAMAPIFDRLENGLAARVQQEALRLFRWVEYMPDDLQYLLKPLLSTDTAQ